MNPARELHKLLFEWRTVPGGSSILNVRTAVPDELAPMNGYTRLVSASWYLGEVGRSLDTLEAAGEDVEAYRAFLPAWWDALYVSNQPWNAGTNGETDTVPWDSLATLNMYAGYLDKTRIQPYLGDVGGFVAARNATDQIVTTLRAQGDIDPDTKTYVFELLDQIRGMLDAEDLRVHRDLIRKVNELRGWLAVYEDFLEAKAPGNPIIKKLKKAAKTLVPPSKLLFGAGGFALGAAADLVQITQGAGS
ncbi:hypothetical protein ACI3KX_00500 [Microbacterium sp. ZW CA_36]|uniref:hypothetical protein n=1 Tax=Microbacterium sp. ZW CA_36 TaxID=3378078 RepID=UPI003851B93F